MDFSKKKKNIEAFFVNFILVGLLLMLTACTGNGSEPDITSPPLESPQATAPEITENDVPKVECSLDYSKPAIDIYDSSKEYDWIQRIQIPRLVWDSDGARHFNDRIMMENSSYLQTIKNNEEGDLLCDITYMSSITDNHMVAIIIDEMCAWQYSEGYNNYSGYYYDTELDKEITLNEYLFSLGFTSGKLFEAAVNRAIELEPQEIDATFGDAVLIDGDKIYMEVNCTFVHTGMEYSTLVELNSWRAAPSESAAGWVTTLYGRQFYIPEGFERESTPVPPSGYSYTYYNPDLDTRIVVWESTIYNLPFESGEEWINNDYGYYEGYTYLTRGNDYMVASGYDPDDGGVFYIREQFEGDLIFTYNITYPNKYYDEGSAIVEQFAKDFKSGNDVPANADRNTSKPETIGWVITEHGHKFYIPEGFVAEDTSYLTDRKRYSYIHSKMGFHITVEESTVQNISENSGQDWLNAFLCQLQ